MQSRHIQQIKLEIGGGTYHPSEQLEEVGVEPTQEEMTEVNLSEEEAEKNSVVRLQNWSLQKSGQLVPHEMKIT